MTQTDIVNVNRREVQDKSTLDLITPPNSEQQQRQRQLYQAGMRSSAEWKDTRYLHARQNICFPLAGSLISAESTRSRGQGVTEAHIQGAAVPTEVPEV